MESVRHQSEVDRLSTDLLHLVDAIDPREEGVWVLLEMLEVGCAMEHEGLQLTRSQSVQDEPLVS